MPRSASLRAMRPGSLSDTSMMDTEDTQRGWPVQDDYPESMAGSVSTLSSHPGSPATSNRSPLFGPAMYMSDHNQISDTVDIMPHSRQTSFELQHHNLTDSNIKTKASLPTLSPGRPQSLNLPLRTRKDSPTGEKTNKYLKRATTYIDRASLSNPGRTNGRAFE